MTVKQLRFIDHTNNVALDTNKRDKVLQPQDVGEALKSESPLLLHLRVDKLLDTLW